MTNMLITDGIRQLATLLKFATAITKEGIETILKKIETIVHDDKNFMSGPEPLTLSATGLQKLNQIAGEDFKRDKTIGAALKTLHRSMELAAKTGNEQIAYALKLFDKSPHAWSKIDLRDNPKRKIRENFEALTDFLNEPVPSKTVSPEELKEMKERGIMAHLLKP
jgi:hypothetical protein